MSCPYKKETSFGRDRGYLVCTNPAKRMRHCDPDACNANVASENGAHGEYEGCTGVVVSDNRGTRRVCKKVAANMLMDFFENAAEQTGGW